MAINDFFIEKHLDRLQSQGRSLFAKGKYAEAFDVYMTLWEQSKRYPPWGGVRLSFLLSDMFRVGEKHPPALSQLREMREQREAAVRQGTADSDLIQELDALNGYLDTPERSLEIYEQLQLDDPASPTLARFKTLMFEEIVSAGRYSDFTDYDLAMRLMIFKEMSNLEKNFPNSLDDESLGLHRKHTTQTGLSLLECAIGKGTRPIAEKTYEILLKSAKTGENYAAMINVIAKTSNSGWIRRVIGDAKAGLPEDQWSPVMRAAEEAGVVW